MSKLKPLPLRSLMMALCALLPVAALAQTAPTQHQASQPHALQAESVNDPAIGADQRSNAVILRAHPGTSFAAGNEIMVPDLDGSTDLAKAYMVVVDKSDAIVSLGDASGKTYVQFPAPMGSTHDPLPLGKWKINGVARDPTLHYNPDLFWEAEAKDSKATLPAGANNLVGAVWVYLSNPHYGIHGTPVASHRQDRLAWLHPPDQLGCPRPGISGIAGHGSGAAGVIPMGFRNHRTPADRQGQAA